MVLSLEEKKEVLKAAGLPHSGQRIEVAEVIEKVTIEKVIEIIEGEIMLWVDDEDVQSREVQAQKDIINKLREGINNG